MSRYFPKYARNFKRQWAWQAEKKEKQAETEASSCSEQLEESPMSPIVRPQGFSLEELRQTLGHSVIRDQCYFIYGTNNVLEIIAGFNELLNQEAIEFGAEQLASVYVTGMVVYLLHHEDMTGTLVKRTLFLQSCFDYLACAEETHIHQICVHILDLLDANNSGTMLNLIHCCRVASPLSTMARVIGNCLLWAMLDRLSNLGLDSHRLRASGTLLLVAAVVNPRIYLQSYMHALHLVVRLVSSLLVVGPLGGHNQQFCQETGVPEELMQFSKEDAAILVRWLIVIVEEMRPQMVESEDLGRLGERLVLLEAVCELMQLLHGHLVKCHQEINALLSTWESNRNEH
ncbi:uncharacterized protein LOC128264572 isoform X1 [Drosophila gunungcola]|uniref:uncharacterized protein LOC128264572 isoform X1 n=1 Tax=Drosophila gunungcola TaxID=103775 RepID=UPI0022E8FE31|nr:uncharacterized protein LOC128264572 isoform X1 [Drosophila gunungcola]